MIRSFAFTTQGRLHSTNIDVSVMPTLLADTNIFIWVDLEKPTAEETKSILESVFHFHPLSIEDCVAPSPSPKVEEYAPREGDVFSPYMFIVMHAVDYSRKNGLFATTELNFFLGKNFLVTYHDVPMKAVDFSEERCLRGTGKPARGPDRVAHVLLDGLVENYNPALDELANEISALEEQALRKPSRDVLDKLLKVKKEVGHLRRIMVPQREVLARFAHGEVKFIRPHLIPYYRDVYDSLFHISELAQSYADSLTGILQVYLNMSANETGEVMKLLTMITLIATPLTLIGTWYGMNFEHMPEYHWKYGYVYAIGLMVASTAATYWYFKRKKWF
jgi:magnesium transporter